MLNCSVSELNILRNFWESIKETASALACSWDTALDFKPDRAKRTVNFVDEDNTIKKQEQKFKVNVFYKTIDVTLMQLQDRFFDQNMITSTFGILFPTILARSSNESITKHHQL